MFECEKNNSNPKDSAKEIYKFNERLDSDGIREIISIGNENPGGCPFSCVGCGVHDQVVISSSEDNKKLIDNLINEISLKINKENFNYQSEGYHICVYNEGNVANPKELSWENLEFLLLSINNLEIPPKFISLNSRSVFITREFLEKVNSLGLNYNIHFIMGVESLTERGKNIYGKKNIDKEIEEAFNIIKDFNNDSNNKIKYGIDAGFVFLPEFYLDENESRENKEKIKNGFEKEIMDFIEKYSNKGVPIRINLHPFYRTTGLSFDDSCNSLNEFFKALPEIIKLIQEKNKQIQNEKEKTAIFIGVNGKGYETEEWKEAIKKWEEIILKLNSIKDYESEECRILAEEIEKM